MTKKELIEEVTKRLEDYPAGDVAFAVDAMFESMRGALVKGDRIEIRDFGVFMVRSRESRMGRNPKTGTKVYVSSKKVPFFKVGRELKKMVDYR